MLMPNAAFCTGLQTIAKFEAARVGVQWGDVFMEVSWHKLPRFEMLQLCNVKTSGFQKLGTWSACNILQQVPQVPQIAWSFLHNPGEWESEILRAFLQLCKVRNCSFISVLAMMCLDIVLPFACRQYARSIDVRFVHHIHTTSTWQKRGSSSCWAQVYGAGLVLWSRAAQRVWRAPVSQLHISTIILAVHLEALQCETCTVYVNPFSF